MTEKTGLRFLRVEHLRCLDQVEFEADFARNIIVGENGAGKTSILEALYFLGRGKSFRPGQVSTLIQSGCEEFTVFGEVAEGALQHKLGISQGKAGLRIHHDGETVASIADLAGAMPVQVIDPDVHQLIQGGPKGRREFLDWGVFHVKHEFLANWRRYRRALRQRNAALKQGASKQVVRAWDNELIEFGQEVDSARRQYLIDLMPLISSISGEILQKEVKCTYQPGWLSSTSFPDALDDSWERDFTHGATQVGPHRAELMIEAAGHAARNRLSRGQQKLLSIAMVVAQSIFVARSKDRAVTLLVDEPAAELDSEHLRRLIDILTCSELQLFISTLDQDALPVSGAGRVFHVERGALSILI